MPLETFTIRCKSCTNDLSVKIVEELYQADRLEAFLECPRCENKEVIEIENREKVHPSLD